VSETTPPLFPVEDYTINGVRVERIDHMSATERQTHLRRVQIANGIHPMGGALRKPAGETCGSCNHCVTVTEFYPKRFHKCALTRRSWTRGPGSDIRKRWPACERWEGSEKPPEPPERSPTIAKNYAPDLAPTLGGSAPKEDLSK